MKLPIPVLSAVILLFTTLLSVNTAQALKSDRDQPADIEADDIEFDFKKGIRSYINNVSVVQGTLRVKADKVVTLYDKEGELTKASATGNLAHFKQRPDDKPDDVEGSAKTIIVNQKENTLTLIGSASIKQGGDTARGEKIVYNMANDTLQVKGDAKVGAAGKPGAKPAKPVERKPVVARPVKKKPVDKELVEGGLTGANADNTNVRIEENADGEKSVEATSNSGIVYTRKAEPSEEGEDGETETTEPVEYEYVPTETGRSRLIIQPREEEPLPETTGEATNDAADDSSTTEQQ